MFGKSSFRNLVSSNFNKNGVGIDACLIVWICRSVVLTHFEHVMLICMNESYCQRWLSWNSVLTKVKDITFVFMREPYVCNLFFSKLKFDKYRKLILALVHVSYFENVFRNLFVKAFQNVIWVNARSHLENRCFTKCIFDISLDDFRKHDVDIHEWIILMQESGILRHLILTNFEDVMLIHMNEPYFWSCLFWNSV